MKTTGNIKLNVEFDFEGVFIVITCVESDFRLAWAIGKVMDIEFNQVPETVYSVKGSDSELCFSRFEYLFEEKEITWRLQSNRCPEGYLAPEFRNFDYILIVFGEFPPNFADEITRKLRTVRFITSAFNVSVETVKTKELLLT